MAYSPPLAWWSIQKRKRRGGFDKLAASINTVPKGKVGEVYAGLFVLISGGTAPYTVVRTGALPAGLSMSANGTVTGTPTVAGKFPLSVEVSDAAGAKRILPFVIEVEA